MNQSKRFHLGALLAVILLVAAAFAEATPTASPDSVERSLLGLNTTEPHNELLPDFGPEIFETIKKDPKILATYGKISTIKIEMQKRNWLDKLDEIIKGGRNRIDSYFYPAGPVLGYGYDYKGYIFVTFKDNSSKTLMDEIYKIIYSQAMQRGVPEIPVVFESGNIPQLDSPRADYNYFYYLIPTGYEITATYGKLPVLDSGNQRQNWSNNLEKLGKSLEIEFSLNYIYPNGKVITYGENSRGYFVVVFYKNLTIERALIDEVYAKIDEKATNMGIQEVPVEFGRGGFPVAVGDGRSEAERKADEEYEQSGRGSYKPVVIATYGKLPELKTEDQRFNWFYRDQRAIIESSRDKIVDKYFYPKGPLVTFGTYSDGYFEATVYRNLTVEKSLLDEIYGIIDEEAKKRGIHEVPVRFVLGDMVRPLLIAAKDSNKAVLLGEVVSNKSVPGFVLLGGLISLLSIWLLRRR